MSKAPRITSKGALGCLVEDIDLAQVSDEQMQLLKAAFAGGVIAFASWLAEKRPDLAGFILALPLASIIALVITQTQTQNSENTIMFAKSILVGVPLSYLFFVPFFLPQVSRFGFWITLSVGLLLLVISYFIHQFILKWVA